MGGKLQLHVPIGALVGHYVSLNCIICSPFVVVVVVNLLRGTCVGEDEAGRRTDEVPDAGDSLAHIPHHGDGLALGRAT